MWGLDGSLVEEKEALEMIPGFVKPSVVFTHTISRWGGETVMKFSVIGELSFTFFFLS